MLTSISAAVPFFAAAVPVVAEDGGEKAMNVIMIVLTVIQILIGLGPTP